MKETNRIKTSRTSPHGKKQCNGETQLTKHRKNSEQCQHQYWDGLYEMKHGPNRGREQLFISNGYIDRHMRYNCGKNGNPLSRKSLPGEVVGGASLSRFGIPKEDLQSSQANIFFGQTQLTRNCEICNFARNEYQYQRRQFSGHVKSQRCYESRIPAGEWNIPMGQKYKEPQKTQLHMNLPPTTQFAINTNKIRPITNKPEVWKCIQRGENRGDGGDLLIHIAIPHQCIPRVDIICTYCAFTIRNLGNLRIHLQNTCPNKPEIINARTWNDFEIKYPGGENAPHINKTAI